MSEEELNVLREMNERLMREEERRRAEAARRQRSARGCLIALAMPFIAFFAIFLLVMRCEESPETQARRAKEKRCGDEFSAYSYSKNLIREKLLSPSSAIFPPHGTEGAVRIEEIECGRYKVSSYVEASNAFGALIRRPYSALMIYHAEDQRWSGSGVINDETELSD